MLSDLLNQKGRFLMSEKKILNGSAYFLSIIDNMCFCGRFFIPKSIVIILAFLFSSAILMAMSPSFIILMKRIFLTLGILFFAGGSYYIGQNYTLVQLNNDQITQINTG